MAPAFFFGNVLVGCTPMTHHWREHQRNKNPMSKTFKALVVSETSDKRTVREIRERSTDELPPGDVLVRVHYSGLNYKDALSASGHRGVTKRYPHTPGIDAAGVVEESTGTVFRSGDQVLCTGFDLGMDTSGGFGQYIR